MQRKHILGISAGAVALVILAGGAGALIMDQKYNSDKAAELAATAPAAGTHVATHEHTTVTQAAPAPAAAPIPSCNDENIVGTAIGGALGGAVLGHEYIPTRNVTCR